MTNKEKAIAVAIRYHFCDAVGIEQQIYQELQKADGDMLIVDFAHISWLLFDNLDIDGMMTAIDNLINDILSQFGE